MRALQIHIAGALFAFALASTAWAQQPDLEVTMDVVPANALPDAVTREIKLPDTANARAREAAAFGLETANKARELGRDFGKEVSQAARDRAEQRRSNVAPSKR